MLRKMTRDRFLSDAQLSRFMEAVRTRRHKNQPRDHALFALLANTGMRPSEARDLPRGDLHLDGSRPWIQLARPTLPRRPVPLNQLDIHTEVAAVLARYCATFPASARLWTFTKRQAARLFHYYARKAGLPKTYRIYCLRHTLGMRLYRFTRNVRLVQAVMGHRWLAATQVYMHTDPAVLRSALQEAMPRP